ncbi:MAG: carbohydrate ABC transporter permease [Treponema sp.]|nr:carbohydrate ABC transporter permease [Treponema sp.]
MKRDFFEVKKKSLNVRNDSQLGDYIIVFIFIILILLCILPILNVFSRAMSSPEALVRGQVTIYPVGFSLESFRMVWEDAKYPRSLSWTVILTIICTFLSLAFTIACAYPFVYKDLVGRKVINTLLILTMYFSAGTIPSYILMRSLGLLDNPLVLIIPNALSIFNFILMRSFFYSVSDSLRESAQIDGAGPIRILISIYLPLSKPALATIALFYAVGRWNGYGDALLYMTNRSSDWFPIQLLLYNIQQNIQSIDSQLIEGINQVGMGEGVRTATIVIATIPILLVYPFLQKYFIAGATLGAIKE